MSTRSLIGVPYQSDGWRARYCHSDGYPSHQANTLWALVARDGLDAARRTLTEDHYGWSHISADHPEIVGVRANANASYGTAAYFAHQFRGKNGVYADGRFASVTGYGTAYTDRKVTKFGKNYKQATKHDWTVHTDRDYAGAEWLYVLADGGLMVGKVNGHAIEWRGLYRWDAAEPDWGTVECGEHYEHCGHLARWHIDDLPEDCRGLSMQQYLGHEPLSVSDAISVIDGRGVTWQITGGGQSKGDVWYGGVVGPDGTGRDMALYRMKGWEYEPLDGLTYLYPRIPTAIDAGQGTLL